jgi:hypothetical protein
MRSYKIPWIGISSSGSGLKDLFSGERAKRTPTNGETDNICGRNMLDECTLKTVLFILIRRIYS